jgi:hypothetical protein
VLPRYINQAVAQLYAKNPKTVASRKKKLMYKLWDGKPDSLMAAMDMGARGDPMAMQLVMEVAAGVQQNQMLDKMGKTMEILWDHFINEQAFNYKQQLKALVRRTKVCKVGWVKLGFQRILEPRPEIMAQIEDVTSKISRVEGLLKDVAEGEVASDEAEMEELRLLLADLQTQKDLIVREGPVFDFPRATEIIVDPECRHLKSLAGASWVAHEFEMTPEKVEENYKVDIKGSYKEYRTEDTDGVFKSRIGEKPCKARVYEIWDKQNNQVLTVCDGYCDFLREPAAPDLWLERFWPFFPLVLNEIEHDEELYPPSDVENAKHIQEEYNRSREGLREHRIAARPWWFISEQVEEAQRKLIANHDAHAMVTAPPLGAGQKVADMIIPGPTAPIDPNLYEVEMIFTDLMRTVGIQEANIGATGGDTATEASIAEQSRSTSHAENVDDLDELLTELSKATGQLMLMELSKETVVEIVGPGAVWPEMGQSRSEVAKDMLLEIKAGSSGRPNRASELANIERAAPMLVQIPSIKPEPIARKYLELLEIDVEETIAEGMPSITAMNAMMTKAATASAPGAEETGDPASNPKSQGAQGAQNAPSAQQNEPGPQPGYTPPMAVAA